jgi:hypothetical protein
VRNAKAGMAANDPSDKLTPIAYTRTFYGCGHQRPNASE